MKRRIGRLVIGLLGIIGMVLVTLAAYAAIEWDRTYEAPYPEIRASSDTELIERGRYLAYGPAHCAACHTPAESHELIERGERPPLIGGFEWKLPLGTVRSPNITADTLTGIGRYTDAEIARTLRHGVKPNGQVAMPFMEFQNLSDEDLTAVISYLRAAPAVHNPVAPSEPNFVGRAILATMIRPVGPTGTPAATPPAAAPTVERGEYLVNDVAGCSGCHTRRNMVDGSFTGPRMAGGSPMPLDDDPRTVLVPPNLTPDPKTGHIYGWSREQFVARFRAGTLQPGSHMPWALYRTMSEDDLSAIYAHLRSLDPVTNDPGPIRRAAN